MWDLTRDEGAIFGARHGRVEIPFVILVERTCAAGRQQNRECQYKSLPWLYRFAGCNHQCYQCGNRHDDADAQFEEVDELLDHSGCYSLQLMKWPSAGTQKPREV